MTNAVANGATGADQLSSPHVIPTSPADASQSVKNEPELFGGSPIQSAGAKINRRAIVNMLVTTAIAGTAIPAHATRVEELGIDWRAVLDRAERMVDILRTRVIHEHFSMDEESAERMLCYCRNMAAGRSENEQDWAGVLFFLAEHGQSVDWLLSGNPVGLICRSARLNTIERGSKITEDPVLQAIAAHKKAFAAYNELCVQQDELEKAIPRDKRKSNSGFDEMVETDDPRWLEFQAQLKKLADAEDEAECDLANIQPTTVAGVIALLEYAASVEKEVGFREIYFDPDEPDQKTGRSWHYFVNRNLADTLRSIAA